MDPSERIVTISPDRGWFDLGLVEVFRARGLIGRFALRDLTLRYRQTALGVLWVVLQPLAASGILALVFGSFAGLATSDTPYVLTVYAALLPWMFFSQVVQRGGMILVNDRNLVTKTWLPRMALPLAPLLSVAVDFAVALAFFVLLAGAYGRGPGIGLLVIPVLLLPTAALSAGAALVVAGLNVYYRDVRHVIPFALHALFFASPIAYPADRVTGAWAPLLHMNPIAGQAEAFRWALLGGDAFPFASWLGACAASLAMLVIGIVGFRRLDRWLADVI